MSLDSQDIKVIREEGEDIRRKLDDIYNELKETNKLLRDILSEVWTHKGV